jgi:hypothetical protein
VPNVTFRLRAEARRALSQVVGSEMDPLVVLLEFIADKAIPREERAKYCEMCLPYLHPKLSYQQLDANRTEGLEIRFDFGRALPARPQIDAVAEPDAQPAPLTPEDA